MKSFFQGFNVNSVLLLVAIVLLGMLVLREKIKVRGNLTR